MKFGANFEKKSRGYHSRQCFRFWQTLSNGSLKSKIGVVVEKLLNFNK